MPSYDYECANGHISTHFVPYEKRKVMQSCPVCADGAHYQFPVAAALGFQPFETYYDEALDGDITGREDKRLFLKSQGLMEAGDKVRGGRNFDKHAPDHIKPLPPRGVSVWAAAEKQRQLRSIPGDET